MNFLELVKTRQSCRKFDTEKPVEREKIERCIEAARLAPSACNAQPWRYVIVDEPELCEKVAKATYDMIARFNTFNEKAAGFAVIVTEPVNLSSKIGTQLKGIQYRLIDIGMSAEHFCLQATEEGLGTCILGYFSERKLKKLLGVPKRKSIDLVISYGYAEEDYGLRNKLRKTTDQVRSYNEYDF